jgi:hypothetical protein
MTARKRDSKACALAVAISLLAITACGSSSTSSRATNASPNSKLAIAECMRSHGVPNFPDPTGGPGGGGFSIDTSPGSSTVTINGITFSGPAFVSAEKICKLSVGGSGPAPISESAKLAALHFAECMRRHGVPNYPDPKFPAGGGILLPKLAGLNSYSPAVEQAAATCNKS